MTSPCPCPSAEIGRGLRKSRRYGGRVVVELDLSPDCEAALMAAATKAGLTVEEMAHRIVMTFLEQQKSSSWLTEAERNMAVHAETLYRLGE